MRKHFNQIPRPSRGPGLAFLVQSPAVMKQEYMHSLASQIAITMLCFSLAACIGWGRTKRPAYVINGMIGGAGAIMLTSAIATPTGRQNLATAVFTLSGLGLMALALIGTGITSRMQDPEKRATTPAAPALEAIPRLGAVGLGYPLVPSSELPAANETHRRHGNMLLEIRVR